MHLLAASHMNASALIFDAVVCAVEIHWQCQLASVGQGQLNQRAASWSECSVVCQGWCHCDLGAALAAAQRWAEWSHLQARQWHDSTSLMILSCRGMVKTNVLRHWQMCGSQPQDSTCHVMRMLLHHVLWGMLLGMRHAAINQGLTGVSACLRRDLVGRPCAQVYRQCELHGRTQWTQVRLSKLKIMAINGRAYLSLNDACCALTTGCCLHHQDTSVNDMPCQNHMT